MFLDTHAHLYSAKFSEDRDAMLQRAIDAGVEGFYLPNIDVASIEGMLALSDQYPERVFPMMGLHPCDVKADFREQLATIEQWLDRREFCAVGEIGIDLYWDKTYVDQQIEAFRTQCGWAVRRQLPICIHSRESIDLISELLEEMPPEERPTGVFHCFTGTLLQAERILNLGFKMGLGGVLTFKNSGLDKVAVDLPLDALILETDAPYLAPTPHRGKRNESAYIPLVAQKLAEIKGISVEEVARVTTANGFELFGTSAFLRTRFEG